MRTDPEVKKQAGISMLLIDMKSEGLEVRPIELIDGGHEVNEVWFDDVRVPSKYLVGEENIGWTRPSSCSATSGSASPRSARPSGCWPGPRTLAAEAIAERPAAPRARDRARERAAWRSSSPRCAWWRTPADGEPHPASSVLKLKGTELQQAVSELVVDLGGPAILASGEGDATQRRGTAARPRPTSTSARRRSTAGPTRSSARSSAARSWASERRLTWTSPTTTSRTPSATP